MVLPPPHWIIAPAFVDHGNFLLLPPPPPLIAMPFGDDRKFLLLPPPATESRRRLETAENVCYYPPPLNLGDLALHTKGAPSLGKSWICDCTLYYFALVTVNRWLIFKIGPLLAMLLTLMLWQMRINHNLAKMLPNVMHDECYKL